jgi:predicted TIM-barrel fold metal-dependent hydrolase
MKGPDAAALRDLAPTGTMRVAVNVANAALVSKGGDESLAGRIPDLARRLGVPVEMTQRFLDGPGRRFRDGLASAGARFPGGGGRLLEQLGDIDDGRVSEMDAAGVDVQVLSLTAPGLEQVPAGEAVCLARETNDYLAAALGRNPKRLAAFAALPTADPPAAAHELERVVRQHGFVGAMINGHCQGRRLDDEFFWPILESAEALGVPPL